MKRLIATLLSALATLALVASFQLTLSDATHAQPEINDDFTLSWSLEGRDAPEIFDIEGGMGTGALRTGMDFDGDGLKEILFTVDRTLAPAGPDPGQLELHIYEASANDTYDHVWSYVHPDSTNSFPALAYGDVDGDGLWEIFMGIPTVNDDPIDLFIFEQDAAGAWPSSPTVTWDYGRDGAKDFRPSAIQILDVDKDGDVEFITTSRKNTDGGDGREVVVASLATESLDEFSQFQIEFEAGEDVLGGGGIWDMDVTDYDNDGANEIWVNTWDKLSFAVWEVKGADDYGDPSAPDVDVNQASPEDDSGSFNMHDLLFWDMDHDGSQELVLPMTDGYLWILESTDDIATIDTTSFVRVLQFGGRGRGGDVGDIDGDGLFDIIASTELEEMIMRMEYDGVGSLTDPASYEVTTIYSSAGDDVQERYYPPKIADDLDGDGYNEVVITNRYADQEGQPLILILESIMVDTPNEPGLVPDGFALSQNYPNPFNPTTSIQYSLDKTGPVTLKVYNTMGQVVKTLVNAQIQPNGTHQVTWDATNEAGNGVVSGTYIYTLESGDYRVTKQMTLIK